MSFKKVNTANLGVYVHLLVFLLNIFYTDYPIFKFIVIFHINNFFLLA